MERKLYLREWRKKLRFTQEWVASRLEITAATLSRIETGKISYTRESLEAIAERLGLEPADLLRDPDRPDYEAWRIISKMKPDKQSQALRLLKALDEDAA